MIAFTHFVLTNFNVPLPEFSQDRNGVAVLTEEWLTHRLTLFERFCLPSVLGQTNLRFTWLVRYDDTMPGARGRLNRYTGFGNLRIVPADVTFRKIIAAQFPPATPYVVTTRLDNDDALHCEAIADIQAAVEPSDAEFLNFPFGYFRTEPNGQITLEEHRSNAFLTLVERVTDAPLRTARCIDHNRAAEVAAVRQLGIEPRWMHVLHERNLTSGVRGGTCVTEDVERAFNVGPYAQQLVQRCIGASRPR